jgi:hypothetical protein
MHDSPNESNRTLKVQLCLQPWRSARPDAQPGSYALRHDRPVDPNHARVYLIEQRVLFCHHRWLIMERGVPMLQEKSAGWRLSCGISADEGWNKNVLLSAFLTQNNNTVLVRLFVLDTF